MNRRDFIKASIPAAALPAIAITCKYEDDEKGPEKESSGKRWDYRFYCYERKQGEWIFSENIRGSFAPEREYMTFEEDKGAPYAGWMDGGKLHFVTLKESQDFIDCHIRAKDDTNLIDSIYDIYYVDRYHERVGEEDVYREKELQVAHYWFNGDTGKQIHWVSHPHDWTKLECA